MSAAPGDCTRTCMDASAKIQKPFPSFECTHQVREEVPPSPPDFTVFGVPHYYTGMYVPVGLRTPMRATYAHANAND
uniref:DUF1996 domain-containing protein n=1 Tax=Haemonchus contortus TaxID=6289 RepID=A0A7I4Y5G8_HAECO